MHLRKGNTKKLFSCQGSGAKASDKTDKIVSLESVPASAKGVGTG